MRRFGKKNAAHTSPGNPENVTNPMTTLKLLKCFKLSVPYASDVKSADRGYDV